MKLVLPLLLSLLHVAVGQLDVDTFDLDPPSFVQTDAQTLTVTYTHGSGSETPVGKTYQYITKGECPAGGNLPAASNDAITINDGNPVTPSGSGPDYETVYTLTVDIGSDELDIVPDEVNVGKLELCVTHTFTDDGSNLIANFQQTQLTLIYDLKTINIASFTFQTAATDPNPHAMQKYKIHAEAHFCNPPQPMQQGNVACFRVCPLGPGLDPANPLPNSDVGDDFIVTKLENVWAKRGTLVQQLILPDGTPTDADLASVYPAGTNEDQDCKKLDFFLGDSFFDVFVGDVPLGLPVTVTGRALLADKNERRRALRLNQRALGEPTRVTESEFEMDVQLAEPVESGSFTIVVTRFALVGATGAALLI